MMFLKFTPAHLLKLKYRYNFHESHEEWKRFCPESIPAEMLKASTDSSTKILTDLGYIPVDWTKGLIIKI